MAMTGTISAVFNSERNWIVTISDLTASSGNVTPAFLSKGFVIGSWQLSGFTDTVAVDLQGSNDGTNFYKIGSTVAALGLSTLATPTNLVPLYYNFAVTTGTGTGTIIATLMSTFG